jgi:lysozyme family protein
MAGFAMDLGDEGTAYEKGVNAPSASASAAAAQGMANLTKGLFGAMDAYSKAQTRGKPTEASLNKAGFANFVTQLDKLKGVTDPTRLKAGINSAISSYESLGFQLGDPEADAVFRRTGVDISSLTFNPAMAAAEAANKQLIENPAYMFLAEQKLSQSGKPFTSQDVATIALNDMKASEAAALYITSASNISKMEFQESYMPHANKVLQNIRAIALVGLQAEIAGGDVSPESMVQLRTSFDIAKSQLTRPLNITADEFSPVKSQIDTLDALLGRLETYDKDMLTAETMAAMEPISAALLKQAKVLGKTDPILAQALLSDKVDWSTYVARKWPEILKTLEKTETKDTVYTNLNVFDLPEAEVAAAVILHNNEEVEIATDRSDEDRLNAINNAFDFKVKLTQPINLNQPEHRDSFLNGVGQATVNVSTSNKLLSKETMDVLFDNDVFDKLNIVKKLDPEGHTLAVNQLKDALQSQSNIFATTMKGIVESTVFELTGIGEVKLKAEKTTSPSEWAGGLFQAKADKYYGGNIYRMIKDSGRALSTGERTELRGRGWGVEALGRNYSEITRANNQFKTYANYWRRLGGDPSTMESMILTRQEDDATPVATNNNLTADQNAEVTAAINEDFIGIPLEDIDFESNAEATPKEPDEEIVTSPIGGLNLDSTLDEILISEGGFQNRPKDKGNYRPDGTLIGTNRGVTPNSLAEFRGVDPNTITEADIKAVTEDEARQIFKQIYFDKPKLNQLPVNLQEAVFDMQINSGRNAVRILQKLAGMPKDKRDGYVGPETLKALQGVNITNAEYADARIEFYNNLVKSDPDQYGENLAGWIARANKYRNK